MPRRVDPDDIQVTEVDALLIQPAVAGAPLGPQVCGRAEVGLQGRLPHTIFEEDTEGERQQRSTGRMAGHGRGLRRELEGFDLGVFLFFYDFPPPLVSFPFLFSPLCF